MGGTGQERMLKEIGLGENVGDARGLDVISLRFCQSNPEADTDVADKGVILVVQSAFKEHRKETQGFVKEMGLGSLMKELAMHEAMIRSASGFANLILKLILTARLLSLWNVTLMNALCRVSNKMKQYALPHIWASPLPSHPPFHQYH